MELVRQSIKVLGKNGTSRLTKDEGKDMLRLIEQAGRTCYKSEWKNEENDFEKTKKFVKGIITRGHLSVIEHANVSVRFITNRGCTHELVRHRLAAYSQESTRYCNYGNEHVKFIIPPWSENLTPEIVNCEITSEGIKFNELPQEMTTKEIRWLFAMGQSENEYQNLINSNQKPQFARGVLPIDLKTEIVMTANLREWRHVFAMRCQKATHPQIRELMLPVLSCMKARIPIVFDDLEFYYDD